jgi:hypothetical protein
LAFLISLDSLFAFGSLHETHRFSCFSSLIFTNSPFGTIVRSKLIGSATLRGREFTSFFHFMYI